MQAIKHVVAALLFSGCALWGCVASPGESTSDEEELSIAPPPKQVPPRLDPPPSSPPKHPTIPPFDPDRGPLEQCLSCHTNGIPNGPPKPYDPHKGNYPNQRGKKLPPGRDMADPICLACHTEDPDPIEVTALPPLE